jgi:exodeoxyribonuclease-3
VKIATWNVNSIRARQERVLAWIAAQRPDVLCLQEIKSEDGKFPVEAFRALGYDVATFGQRTYNGVAILATSPVTDVVRGFDDGVDDAQARFLAGTVRGVRVLCAYVPNGDTVGSPKWAYKLDWMDRLACWLGARVRDGADAVLCGDFNVAPAPLDVHDPALWERSVLFAPEARAALERIRATGFVDVPRALHPAEPLFSWWDYRMLSFPKNRGLRIDHVFATPGLAARAVAAGVDREARKGAQPSDHAPVWVEFGGTAAPA